MMCVSKGRAEEHTDEIPADSPETREETEELEEGS